MNITVTTMGDTWSIIPELLGFIAPGSYNFYLHHPEYSRIHQLYTTHIAADTQQLWIIATSGARIGKALDQVKKWGELSGISTALKMITADGIEDISRDKDSLRIRDLILRTVMAAKSSAGRNGNLILSLAGGRKTMSADMQFAATMFGCDALVHILDRGVPAEFRNPAPETLILPPEQRVAACFMPMVIGSYRQNPVASLLDSSFMPQWGESAEPVHAECSTGLLDRIDTLMRSAHNYISNLSDKHYESESSNYTGILMLPPEKLTRLRQTLVGVDPSKQETELSLCRQLPKAELHCHFGGCLTVDEIIEIALLHEEEVQAYQNQLQQFLSHWQKYILTDPQTLVSETHKRHNGNFFKHIRTLFPQVPQPYTLCAFVQLFKHHPGILEQIVFGRYPDESRFSAIGISAYEALGDIQGSSLLQTEKAIRRAMQLLLQKLMADNVRYLELRCSPVNYTRGGLSEEQVFDIIASELDQMKAHVKGGILFIASRHGRMSDVYRHIELMERIIKKQNRYADLLLGFDLAGNENIKTPDQLREAFLPVMDRCMNITIHAGETAAADSIWQAVYSLNAERIGHGLRLNENPNLKKKFLDRGIAIEMCPSSNFQIIGFRDNHYPEQTEPFESYPLKDYLDYGLKVTVNTDNIGISRTRLSEAYVKAARLSKNGLSLIQILQMIKNGFTASFADFSTKKQLLIESERQMLQVLEDVM